MTNSGDQVKGDEERVRAAVPSARLSRNVGKTIRNSYIVAFDKYPEMKDPTGFLSNWEDTERQAWHFATKSPEVVAFEARSKGEPNQGEEPQSKGIQYEVWTPDKAIARLNEIHKDVQGQIHDQWDWMDASFCVEVLRCAIEDASLKPEAPLGDRLPDLEFANGEYVSVYETLGAELDAKDAEIARLVSRALEAEAKVNLKRFARCECWWNPDTGYLEACPEHLEQAGTKPDMCANCGKVYADHLLHDGNKCAPGSINGWFPKKLADAFKESMKKPQGGDNGNI